MRPAHGQILKPAMFEVNHTRQPLTGNSPWCAAGIHHPIAAAADIAAAHFICGNLDLGGRNPSAFKAIRISLTVPPNGSFNWSASAAQSPRSRFWLPLPKEGRLEISICDLLADGAQKADEITENNKTGLRLHYTASLRDLSNHQLIALKGLISQTPATREVTA